ncbi:MAG: GC-type dockerin domain-anchored protein [Phycisphaerae bacterium]
MPDASGSTVGPTPSFEPLEPRLLLDAAPLVGDAGETDLTGPLGPGVDVPVQTQAADGVTGFTLINADADTAIGPLLDGDTLNLSAYSTSLSVRADTEGPVSRVSFTYDGSFVRTENVVPYALGGDSGGDEVVDGTFAAADLTVDGDGTDTLTLQIAGAWDKAVDTWVKVTLSYGAGHLADLDGHVLDGEPAADSSGLGYLYEAADDLPSGDGTAGGQAVFYVGSLRADMRGSDLFNTAPDGQVNSWDINGFLQRYQGGDLDADLRGTGLFASAPDGVVNSWGINGFLPYYQAAMTNGTHLDPLPTAGGLSAGDPTPLALPGAGGLTENADDDAADTAAPTALLASGEGDAADPAMTEDDPAAPTAALTGTTGETYPAPAAEADLWLPPEDAADDSDPVDALAGTPPDRVARPACGRGLSGHRARTRRATSPSYAGEASIRFPPLCSNPSRFATLPVRESTHSAVYAPFGRSRTRSARRPPRRNRANCRPAWARPWTVAFSGTPPATHAVDGSMWTKSRPSMNRFSAPRARRRDSPPPPGAFGSAEPSSASGVNE